MSSWLSKAVKSVTKKVKQNFKHLGADLNWNEWGQGALLGVATMGVGNALKSVTDAQKDMASAQAAGYDKIAAAMKSQPTANASLAAGAALEQDVGSQLSEQAVQRANKRRRTLQSTVNKLGTSGGLGGRATLG